MAITTAEKFAEKFKGIGADLNLEGLSKHYGNIVAADDVNLQITAGEFITLLGPSGSGKTTTLMMVAGFVEPTSGSILLNKENLRFKPPHKRNIGIVFQSYALFPHMTVGNNIAFPLKIRRIKKQEIRAKVSEALELVGLGGYQDRQIRQLSGGQQQRVALARALVYNPPLLLMDEPLGSLDRRLRERMQLEIKRIQRASGLTVMYVTHDQEEALVMSDRIAIMHAGRLVQLGSPGEVYGKPASAFVADFLGESNLLKGTYVDVEGDHAVVRLSSGTVVKGLAANNFSQGDRVYVTVRPERAYLADGGTSRENECTGRLDEIVFIGDAVKYLIRLDGENTLIVKKPNVHLVSVEQGQELKAGWEIGSTMVHKRDN